MRISAALAVAGFLAVAVAPAFDRAARAANDDSVRFLAQTSVQRTRCETLHRARPKIARAQKDLAGVLDDFARNDSEYYKLKEAIRQITDADNTIEDRLTANDCSL